MEKSRALSLLGVKPGVSQEDLKKAFHRLAQQYHPDRLQGATPEEQRTATERMAEINNAYTILAGLGAKIEEDFDYFSLVRRANPEGPREVHPGPVYVETAKPAPKEKRGRRYVSPEEEHRRRIEKFFALQKNMAAPSEKEYVEALIWLYEQGSIRFGEKSFFDFAKMLDSLGFDRERKLHVVKAFGKQFFRFPEDVIYAVRSLCEAGANHETEKFKKTVIAAFSFNLLSMEDYKKAYVYLSTLEEKHITAIPAFAGFIKTNSILVGTAEQVEKVVGGTLAHTSDLGAAARLDIRKYITAKDSVADYLSVMPMLLSPGKSLHFSIASDLAQFSTPPDKAPILSMLMQLQGDLHLLKAFVSDLHWKVPFREAPVSICAAAAEQVHNILQTGVSPKAVVGFFVPFSKCNKALMPDLVAQAAEVFFKKVAELHLDPDEAARRWKSFMTQKNSKESPAWTDEMRKTYRRLLLGHEVFLEELEDIITAFSASCQG